MRHLLLTIVSFFALVINVHAYKVKDVNIFSEAMKKEIPVRIVTPENYKQKETFPVVYLLHGHSGNYKSWTEGSDVEELSDLYNIIVVMPDGGFDSWYFDSRIAKDYQYETFVSSELVTYIDTNFKTIKDRSGRAITGLSMGGHGAMYIAIRHQDVFGSAGTTSGGVDIRPFPEKWNISARLGTYQEHPENWESNTVINMTHLLSPGSLNIIIDCGFEDFFYEVNCNLHDKLLKEGIPHDFYTRPGKHNWQYWKNSIKYQMLFFSNSFIKMSDHQ